MSDDILARIPDLVRQLRDLYEPNQRWDAADALEAAHARIAALEIDLELGWSRSGLQERVALALRERDNAHARRRRTGAEPMSDDTHGFLEDARARIAELETERDQYKFLLTESHSSDYYRAEKAEAERDEWRRHAGMLDKKLNRCLDEGFRTAQDAERKAGS